MVTVSSHAVRSVRSEEYVHKIDMSSAERGVGTGKFPWGEEIGFACRGQLQQPDFTRTERKLRMTSQVHTQCGCLNYREIVGVRGYDDDSCIPVLRLSDGHDLQGNRAARGRCLDNG